MSDQQPVCVLHLTLDDRRWREGEVNPCAGLTFPTFFSFSRRVTYGIVTASESIKYSIHWVHWNELDIIKSNLFLKLDLNTAAGSSQSVRVKWSLADTCSMQQVSTAGSLHASSLSNIMTRISQSVLSLTKERTDWHALYSNVFVWHHQMSDYRMKDEWQTDTIIIIQEISNIKPIKPQTNCTPDYFLSWLCKETRRISGML